MSYKVTLEVYVNEQTTYPTIKVESQTRFDVDVLSPGTVASSADTQALEGVLTRTRQFAETLLRGVETKAGAHGG